HWRDRLEGRGDVRGGRAQRLVLYGEPIGRARAAARRPRGGRSRVRRHRPGPDGVRRDLGEERPGRVRVAAAIHPPTSRAATTLPARIARYPRTRLDASESSAHHGTPPRSSASGSKARVEKVVNDPRKPVPIATSPCGESVPRAASPATSARSKQPRTFTPSVAR